MKRTLRFLAIAFMLAVTSVTVSFGQAPQKFNYQAVCRDLSGNIIANQAVTLRMTIHDISATGAVLYQETHAVTTNNFGLVNVAVGGGTVVSGVFASISWGSGAKYLQIEVNTGSGYTSVGAPQLLSVPYALYANQANVPGVTGPTGPIGPVGTPGPVGPTGPIGPTGATGALVAGTNMQTLRHNGADWVANSILTNNGANIGINTAPQVGKKLYVYRGSGNYGPDSSTIYAYRYGVSGTAASGGTSWARTGVDAAIKGYSFYGNNFTAGVGGYNYLDYNNSAGVIGANSTASTFGALTFRDDLNTVWAGYFYGNAKVTGTVTIAGGSPDANKVLTATNTAGDAVWQSMAALLPVGTSGQTLRHDGTNWIANSILFNDGTNVGVGTTTPGTKFEVNNGTIGLKAGSIAFEPATYATYGGFLLHSYAVVGSPQLSSIVATGTTAGNWSSDMAFYTRMNNESIAERMRIKNNGNIGIGTSAPAAQLHTTGTVKFEGAGTPGANKVLTSDATGGATWQATTGLPGTIADAQSILGWCAQPGALDVITWSGPKVTLTITSTTQKVHLVANVVMGAGASAATNLDIWPAYAATGSTTPTVFGGGSYDYSCPANTRSCYTTTSVITGLTPGIYDFGVAVRVSNALNWTNNEYGYISVFVIN